MTSKVIRIDFTKDRREPREKLKLAFKRSIEQHKPPEDAA